jgi:hypothetical protein
MVIMSTFRFILVSFACLRVSELIFGLLVFTLGCYLFPEAFDTYSPLHSAYAIMFVDWIMFGYLWISAIYLANGLIFSDRARRISCVLTNGGIYLLHGIVILVYVFVPREGDFTFQPRSIWFGWMTMVVFNFLSPILLLRLLGQKSSNRT